MRPPPDWRISSVPLNQYPMTFALPLYPAEGKGQPYDAEPASWILALKLG
jgi:hypothetical protein